MSLFMIFGRIVNTPQVLPVLFLSPFQTSPAPHFGCLDWGSPNEAALTGKPLVMFSQLLAVPS